MKAVGLILAGGNSAHMKELTSKRAVAAMPLAGTYRSIDFTLSNMTNSGINTVAVISQYSSRSLNAHLSSSKWWDFGRKQGGLYLLNPTITPDNGSWYLGTADALAQNLEFLKERHEPYVVIASGDGVYKLDYNKVVEQHTRTGAEVTVVCKELAQADAKRFGVLEVNDEGRITAWSEKEDGEPKEGSSIVNCGIYVARRRHLIQILEECKLNERYDLVRDILIRHLDTKRIMAYLMDGYWTNINSVESYFACNQDLLDPALRHYFFQEEPLIYTKVDDFPPAKLNSNACMVNSLVAGGSIINGTVEDSVLFKKVYVGDGSTVKNCILLDDAYVGDNVTLENCIVEKHTKIADGTQEKGSRGEIKILS
ncbi:MAG: glucose-1-phosphate adenylyltransferase subunit GlgD [Lachnospiraceae bacterium]|nr:glucose-1-phosphate adenylyltransferase subunit GlgD [Lachnospiraceae bacterium]